MATPRTQLYNRTAPDTQPQPLFINRDTSLVEFYRRVLDEGLDRSQPLLERVKFLSIFSSLIDEFFMVRVSGLKEKAGSMFEVSQDGSTAAAQFASIRRSFHEMSDLQMACLRTELLPELKQN